MRFMSSYRLDDEKNQDQKRKRNLKSPRPSSPPPETWDDLIVTPVGPDEMAQRELNLKHDYRSHPSVPKHQVFICAIFI